MSSWELIGVDAAGRRTIAEDGVAVHVVPIDDTFEHELAEGCTCGPIVVEYRGGGRLVSHESLDGRELLEPGYPIAPPEANT